MVEQQTRENPVTRIDPVLRIYWEQKREIAELKAQIIRQEAASDRLKAQLEREIAELKAHRFKESSDNRKEIEKLRDKIETSRRAISSIIAEMHTH